MEVQFPILVDRLDTKTKFIFCDFQTWITLETGLICPL